ncbi:hypothetical protein FACUT_12679 [Fusarium acutatum]|uniref:Uncharacterized protein n=1 Tax=Fusarium acutatum TaxID=78861 RepID=A0A8H4JD59_9HYPO|nr:hypothetical protein FACUT_12679 [Fusarium acutatum]
MDLLNLVAILGKMNFDFKDFPELTQHIAFHLEKVLTDPHSQFSSSLLSQATSNSITDMLVRKLVMIARDKPTSEPKAKPRPGNETRGTPPCPSRPQPPSQDSVTAKPEPSQFPHRGKGRDASKPAEHASKVPEITVSHHESRGAKGEEEAQSGPSRVRGWPCPFSPPCGGCADAQKKANPPTPKLGSSIVKMKDIVVAAKSSAADWEVPKFEAEQSQKPESSTLVDSDDEGVLVDSETQPITTPSPAGSGNTNRINFVYVYDVW